MTMLKTLEMIHYATLAPSGHNTQPWRFMAGGDEISILPDFSRRLRVVDADDHALFISLGCALENLAAAGAAMGFWVEAEDREAGLKVKLRPSRRGSMEGELFRAIPLRQTNRQRYDGRRIPSAQLKQLVEAARGEGVCAIAFDGAAEMERLTEYVTEASRAQFRDPAFVRELLDWIRFTRREAEQRGDGLAAEAMGLPWAPRWLGAALMRTFAGPQSEARRQVKLLRSSSAALLFAARQNDRRHWVELGRAFERTALTATVMGIAHAHVNMPCEVERVRAEMARGLGLSSHHPLLLVRFGYAPPAPRSRRRKLEEVATLTSPPAAVR
jgi:nitroreductase